MSTVLLSHGIISVLCHLVIVINSRFLKQFLEIIFIYFISILSMREMHERIRPPEDAVPVVVDIEFVA